MLMARMIVPGAAAPGELPGEKTIQSVGTARTAISLRTTMLFVCVCVYRLSQYEDRCHWLKDSTFLHDLESDSVDSDILDEELRSLELHEDKTYARYIQGGPKSDNISYNDYNIISSTL